MAHDERAPGQAWCQTCPDHEACMSGWPCDRVKALATTWAREHMVSRDIDTCRVCGLDTRFVHLAFEAPIHPGWCSRRMQDDYAQALVGS